MSTSAAQLLVFAGEQYACVKIIGRANFQSSIDFKTLFTELRRTGCRCFVLDLSECILMDSTFLGVLAGFGLQMGGTESGLDCRQIELFNANPRVTELLESLGVLHLFRVAQGSLAPPDAAVARVSTPGTPTKEEIASACLEAHRTLMEINPANVAKFKEVARFLAEDLQKLKAGGTSPPPETTGSP